MGKKLVDPDALCMGCMREIGKQTGKCPYCGFEKDTYRGPTYSLPLYEIIQGKYLVGRVIGSGGFGITYIGWDFYQSKKVCIKEYFPRAIAIRNPEANTYIEQVSVLIKDISMYTEHPVKAAHAYAEGLKTYVKEAENLSKFYLLPGIVSVRDFFYGNHTAYIIMEYIDGVDLKHYQKSRGGRLQPQMVFPLLQDVFRALDRVHEANIIHRDISPDNIMLTRDGKAKLIDFGASRNYENAKYAPILLKQGYAPIEQYTKEGKQGPWTDVYSLCASMYYMFTGVRIPKAPDRLRQDTVKRLQVMGVPVSDEQDLAIMKGLEVDAGKRWQSIAELYQALYGEPVRD